jgi:hypothetical protein
MINLNHIELNRFYLFFKEQIISIYNQLSKDYSIKGYSQQESVLSIYVAVYLRLWLLYQDFLNKQITYEILTNKLLEIKSCLNKKSIPHDLKMKLFHIFDFIELGIERMKLDKQPIFTVDGTEYTNDQYNVAYSVLSNRLDVLNLRNNCNKNMLKTTIDDLILQERVLSTEDRIFIFKN